MTDTTDIAALRAESMATFTTEAKQYFADNPDVKSLVFAVSQYWADEAGDAVHEHVYAFREEAPDWPHRCTGEPTDSGSLCEICDEEGGLPNGSLDANDEAVFAWSALCAEYGGGEGESELATPIAIARRGIDGSVDLELTFHLVRPWMDRNTVAENRDPEHWEGDAPPAKPEPTRAPWTARESELLAVVLEDPISDAPRRVLIDHWLEQNDVRGTFGALCFGTKADRSQRQSLADKHGRAWLGPLQTAISVAGAEFDRGPFVSRAVVSFATEADAEAADSIDEWALLHAIRFAGEHRAFNAHMRGLTEVTGVTRDALKSLAASGLVAPIQTLGVSGPIARRDWCATLNGVKTLIIETTADTLRAYEVPFAQFDRVEVWFEDQYAGLPWGDARAARVLVELASLVAPGASVLVGYLRQSGFHGGVVATLAPGSNEVQLEERLYSGTNEKLAAVERVPTLARGASVRASAEPAASPETVIAQPKQPSALRKFFSRFGL